MSVHDEFFRNIKGRTRRLPAPDSEPEEKPRRPLVAQGPRGHAPSPVTATPDSLLRSARGAGTGRGGWTRVA